MKKEEIVIQLEKLASHCNNMDNDKKSIWRKDAEALEAAITLLKEEVYAGKPTDTIKHLMEKDNLNQQKLADRMGTSRQNVNQMLNRGKSDMKYSNFKKVMSELGYEVILRKSNTQNFKK